MKVISIFLVLHLSCSFQEINEPLIIGSWNGTKTRIIDQIYSNDSLVYKNEELIDNIRKINFSQDSIYLGFNGEKHFDTYSYSIDKTHIITNEFEFEVLQLDDSVLRIKVVYSDYKHHLETYKRANE